MTTLSEALRTVAEKTEKRLDKLLPESGEGGGLTLRRAMRYSLLGGGKRLRAFLAVCFCGLNGGEPERALDYAAAIEMIHAFSLIHDDLPAMDNDDMRRGKPSCHKAFGESTAILAGDALSLYAFTAVCSCRECTPAENASAAELIAHYAGVAGMCGGQQDDLDGEGKHMDLAGVTRLVDGKTGALFSCACMLGCIAAGADTEALEQARRFGVLFGRAFQITDDLLDIEGVSEKLGKTAGKDAAEGKSTFVSLLGTEKARGLAAEYLFEARAAVAEGNGYAELIHELCIHIINRRK